MYNLHYIRRKDHASRIINKCHYIRKFLLIHNTMFKKWDKRIDIRVHSGTANVFIGVDLEKPIAYTVNLV